MKKTNGCGGDMPAKSVSEKLNSLSQRQREVLQLAAMGLTPNEMPRRMDPGVDKYPVTVKSVRSYLTRVCEIFGVSTIGKVLALKEVKAEFGIDSSGVAKPNITQDPIIRRPYHQQPMRA